MKGRGEQGCLLADVSGDVWRRGYTYGEASNSRQENVTLARVLGISKEHICIDDKYCALGLSIRQVQFGIH